MVWLKGTGLGAGGLGFQCGNTISICAHHLFSVSPELDDSRASQRGHPTKRKWRFLWHRFCREKFHIYTKTPVAHSFFHLVDRSVCFYTFLMPCCLCAFPTLPYYSWLLLTGEGAGPWAEKRRKKLIFIMSSLDHQSAVERITNFQHMFWQLSQ